MSVQQGFTVKHDDPITLVDSDNNVVHTWDYFNGSYIPTSYNLNVYPNLDILQDTAQGFRLYDSTGEVIWELSLSSTWWPANFPELNLVRHHDSWVMEDTDGSPLILIGGSHKIPMDEAVNNYGRYTNWTPTPYGMYQDTSENMDLGFIQIIKPTGIGTNNHDAELVFEWYMVDHLVQDTNSDLPNYGDINDPTKININLPGSTYGESVMGGVFNGSDFMHHNTIHYDPIRNNVIISSRNIGEGEFYVVSVATGEIVYRCCNPQNYGRGEAEDRYTNGSHGPNVIPDGYPNAGDIIWYNNEGPVDQYCGILGHDCISEVIKVTPEYEVFPSGDFDNIQDIQIIDYDFVQNKIGGGAFGLPNGNIFVTTGVGYPSLEIQDPWTSPEIVQEIPNENQEFRMVKYVCDSEQTDGYMYRVDIPECVETDYQLGDVNQDGLLNVLDIVQIVNYILGIMEFDELSQSAADVTQDGVINVLDVVTLVNQILPSASSRDRQLLEEQLDRLGGSTNTREEYVCTCLDGTQECEPSSMNPGYWSSCEHCLHHVCGEETGQEWCDNYPDNPSLPPCTFCDNCELLMFESPNIEYPLCPFVGQAYAVGSGWWAPTPNGEICAPAQWTIPTDYNNDGVPDYLTFTLSVNTWYWQGHNVTLNGQELSPNDWVGAFCNGSIVGASLWDTSLCGQATCDVQVYGMYNDPDDCIGCTDNYCQFGQVPEFKIWQASTNTYHVATPSHDFEFESDMFTFYPMDASIDLNDFLLTATTATTTTTTLDYDLHRGRNLISIPLILEDTSVSSVFGNDVTSVIGEGSAAENLPPWVGSLSDIDPLRGYWLAVDHPTSLSISGTPLRNPTYNLHEGTNLISFSGMSSVPVDVALQGYEDVIESIISEGEAVSNLNGNWVGSLSEFQVGDGYWFKVNQDTTFQYNLMSTFSTSQNYTPMDISLPRDLFQANINDVFDDIRNQVESQIGSVKPIPIRQLDKLGRNNNQQTFNNINDTNNIRVECSEWDYRDSIYINGYDCTVDGKLNGRDVLNCMCRGDNCNCK